MVVVPVVVVVVVAAVVVSWCVCRREVVSISGLQVCDVQDFDLRDFADDV